MRPGSFALGWLLFAWIASAEDSFYQPSFRSPRQSEIIYFVLPDRFNDGNAANNQGSSTEADQSGFDPSSPHLFHGGDLEGIEQKLDYLSRLGITSIWMTPIFRNRAVQGFGEGVDGIFEPRTVLQEGRDILKKYSFLRKIRHITDEVFEVLH
jgi:hypothetical protein